MATRSERSYAAWLGCACGCAEDRHVAAFSDVWRPCVDCDCPGWTPDPLRRFSWTPNAESARRQNLRRLKAHLDACDVLGPSPFHVDEGPILCRPRRDA